MVLNVHGYVRASCTQAVLATLKEKNVPYNYVPVDLFKGEHKGPEFVKHQPFGQIPYIEDDGFILFESRAICRYIATKYASQGTPLIPTNDIKAIARFEQAAAIEAAEFNPSASSIAREKVYAPMLGIEGNMDTLAASTATLEAKLAGYEVILSKQNYLAGDAFSLADLFHLAYAHLLTLAEVDFLTSGKFPAVAAWYKDISSRASWKEVLADGAE